MFTGIIEELGTVKRMDRGSNSCQLCFLASKVLEEIKLGDSIAINGVCLTVTSFSREYFVADMMAETLSKTNLKDLKNGQRVNLERAVRMGDRMGGHLVQGHIDAIGTIIEQQKVDIARILRIRASAEVLDYLVAKGSVAIDGISLTVVEVFPDSFSVSIIPHTANMTTLSLKKPGETVNVESDIIGRYVEKLLNKSGGKKESVLNTDFLAQHGFIYKGR